MKLVLRTLPLVLLAGLFGTGSATADDKNTFPIVFRIADPVSPVVRRAWIEDQLRQANRVFEPTGIRFRSLEVTPMLERYRDIDTIWARNRLERLVQGGVINCFVVGRLRDIHDPALLRRGVHWNVSGESPKHYVILSKIGPPTTMAHELGHFFGVQGHSSTPGNIMSYMHGPKPAFNEAQMERIRRTAFTELRRGRLFTWQGLMRLRHLRDRAAARLTQKRSTPG